MFTFSLKDQIRMKRLNVSCNLSPFCFLDLFCLLPPQNGRETTELSRNLDPSCPRMCKTVYQRTCIYGHWHTKSRCRLIFVLKKHPSYLYRVPSLTRYYSLSVSPITFGSWVRKGSTTDSALAQVQDYSSLHKTHSPFLSVDCVFDSNPCIYNDKMVEKCYKPVSIIFSRDRK